MEHFPRLIARFGQTRQKGLADSRCAFAREMPMSRSIGSLNAMRARR
jgi:hypothetical protein